MPDSVKRPLLPRIASYSAKDGRTASAFTSETGRSCVGEGSAWAPKVHGGGENGNPGFDRLDAQRTQNPTPVSKRGLG
jgi:hypothetical protein